MASAVAMKVNGVVMTSSFGLSFNALIQRCKPAVPELTAAAYFTPKNFANLFGNEIVLIRFFNTYGPYEFFHPFRSVNCVFTYNLLHNRPITVFNGHHRTSTWLPDAVRTTANIVENFKSGEIYNIASKQRHTIEHLAEVILNETNADFKLVKYIDKHVSKGCL